MHVPVGSPSNWKNFLFELAVADPTTFEGKLVSALEVMNEQAEALFLALSASQRNAALFDTISKKIDNLSPECWNKISKAWGNVLETQKNFNALREKPIFQNEILSKEDITRLTEKFIGLMNTLLNKQDESYSRELSTKLDSTYKYFESNPNSPAEMNFFKICQQIDEIIPDFFSKEMHQKLHIQISK